MAHNISYNEQTGKHEVFVARQAAWHELGQVVTDAQTWEQAMELAGLNWQVEKRQLLDPATGNAVRAWGTFREDNGVFLGAVGSGYTPIQNKHQFDFIDALLEVEGSHYESAGALDDGQKVWCLARVGEGFDVHGVGDKHETYLLSANSHDGSSTWQTMLTATRVVCQNTLNMALQNGMRTALKIRHTKNATDRIAVAQDLFQDTIQTADILQNKLEMLAERKVTGQTLASILGRLFDIDDLSKGLKGNTANSIESIVARYEENDNDAFPEFRGTAYNLLNAITEHTDHYASVRYTEAKKSMSEAEIRAEAALFNGGAKFKQNALDLILSETRNAPYHQIHRAYSVGGGKQTVELENLPEGTSLLDSILDATEINYRFFNITHGRTLNASAAVRVLRGRHLWQNKHTFRKIIRCLFAHIADGWRTQAGRCRLICPKCLA